MALLGPNGRPFDGGPITQPSTEAPKEDPPAPTRVTTAFVIYQAPNGQWFASDDLATPIVPVRKPVPDDLIAGTENVKFQVIARKTADMAAKATIDTQMAMAARMQEVQQNAAIAQMLQTGGK